MKKYRHFETNAVRSQMNKSAQRENSSSIYATSSFVFENAEQARAMFADEIQGNIYTRFSNPNNDEFIAKMCLLEGAEDGVATASGMAAMFGSMAPFLKSGDHLLASRSLFGSTHQVITSLFPRWNIQYSYAPVDKPEEFEKQIKANTRMIFIETPSNPAQDLIDIEWLAALADKHNVILNVDNCFATPFLQNPIKWGAHIVTHSATKFIDGQGRAIGGCILGRKDLMKEVRYFTRHTGPAMSPFNSWILSKSLETLPVRMERHCENALKLAEYLENDHDQVDWVRYPFLPSHPMHQLARKQMRMGGGLVTFELKGGLERGRRFLDALEMCSLTANLGDTKTIVTHPASTTHSKLTPEDRTAVGITEGLIRVSVGLENIEDIQQDIARAVEKSKT